MYTMPQSCDEEEGGNGNSYAPFRIPIKPRPVIADRYVLLRTPLVRGLGYIEHTSLSRLKLIGEQGIMTPQYSVCLHFWALSSSTTPTATVEITAPMNEVPLPFPWPFTLHPTTNPLSSIPLLPPPQHLHVRSSHRNRRLLSPKIPTQPPRTAHGTTPRYNLLVPFFMLFSARIRELYQDGREV